MDYMLMRKDECITTMLFADNGNLIGVSKKIKNPELLPLLNSADTNWAEKWWNQRRIPISQGRVAAMIQDKGIASTQQLLINNLGLSLNDYYWLKPITSNLKWKDVNLFDNDFKENLMVKIDDCGYSNGTISQLTPNSSLQGQLEKSWQIKRGIRILIKGNSDKLSSECMNEVFASMVHQSQNYDNYVDYKLIKIKNKPYEYGCYSACFTNQKLELISAQTIIGSQKKSNEVSSYEHFINVCEEYGIDGKQLRKDLEYQIMTDYILSNRDRHMNNLGILRDADTLQFKRMAPIFDTGYSMFAHMRFPLDERDIVNQPTNSFLNNERKMLKLVQDKNLVNSSNIPDEQALYDLYKKDPNISEFELEKTCEAYACKIKAFKAWQNE